MTILRTLAALAVIYLAIFLLLVVLGRRRTVQTRRHGPVETTFPLGTVDCERCKDGGMRFLTVLGCVYFPLIVVFGIWVTPFSFCTRRDPGASSVR